MQVSTNESGRIAVPEPVRRLHEKNWRRMRNVNKAENLSNKFDTMTRSFGPCDDEALSSESFTAVHGLRRALSVKSRHEQSYQACRGDFADTSRRYGLLDPRAATHSTSHKDN